MFSSRYTFKVLDTEFYYEKNSEKADVNFDLFFKGDSSSVVLYGYNHFGMNHRKTVTKKEHPTLFACLVSLISQIHNNAIVTGNFCGGDLIITKNEFVIDTVYCGKIAVESIEQIVRVKTTTERDGTEYFYALVSDIPKNADCARWLTITKDSYNNIVSLFNGG